MLCSRNPMVAMTLLPETEQQDQRNRGQLHSTYTPPTAGEVNANYSDLYAGQIGRSGDDSPEDLRVCYSSAMEEIQRSPMKPALKRSVSVEDNNGNIAEEGAEKKRQRVENIVTSICQPKSPRPQDGNPSSDAQRNKRKQFIPQQHGSVANGDANVDVVSSDEVMVKPQHTTSADGGQTPELSQSEEKKENALLKSQIKIMSEQLQKNQQITHELTEKMKMERYELMTARLALHQPQFDMESCVRAIRTEINQAVKVAFKEAYEKQCQQTSTPTQSKDKATSTTREQLPREREATLSHHNTSSNVLSMSDQIKRSTSALSSVASPHVPAAPPAHHSLPNPLLPLPLYYGQSLTAPSPFSTSTPLTSQLSSNMMSAQLFQAAMENELMESQLYRDRENQLNKKKRTKVTDTRLSPRNAKPGENVSPNCKQETTDPGKIFDAYGSSSTLFPAINASSMAAMQSAILSGFCPQPPIEALRGMTGSGARSPTNASDNSDQCDPSSPDMSMALHPALPGQNVTLTPLHLRKAKLMFFYVRYPSSVLLKNYFCDVHFNKNNTAQLVKWFSNFREFYYIQMEKYARQSIAEGLSADQVEVTTDSELYKILNLHYNRNNQIEVPRSFLDTIQTTLREFIKAVVLGKDREQSWKKPIYKVIARLDDVVPEYFKSQDWMEQLSD